MLRFGRRSAAQEESCSTCKEAAPDGWSWRERASWSPAAEQPQPSPLPAALLGLRGAQTPAGPQKRPSLGEQATSTGMG